MAFDKDRHNGLCWTASMLAFGVSGTRPAAVIGVRTLENLVATLALVTIGCTQARTIIHDTGHDRDYNPAFLIALERFGTFSLGVTGPMIGQRNDSSFVTGGVASLTAMLVTVHDPLNYGLAFPAHPTVAPLIPGDTVANPSWMTDHNRLISGKKLSALVIPGSHDSGTYPIRSDSGFGPDQDDHPELNTLSYIPAFNGFVTQIIANWARAQPSSIREQLNAGIRYFDIRVGMTGGELVTTHTLRGAKLATILSEVDAFARAHPQEIVILDFNHFYGVSDLAALAATIVAALRGRLVPDRLGPDSTVAEILAAGNVIVLFDRDLAPRPTEIWPRNHMRNIWFDVQDIDVLLEKMREELARPREAGGLMVLQAILTPNTAMIIKGLTPLPISPGSLSALGGTVNPRATDLITSKPGGKLPNIVIMDWFPATRDMVTKLYRMNLGSAGAILKRDEYIRTGEYRVSFDLRFFLILQSDGNLCIYRGSGPNDQHGLLWATMRTAEGGAFFAIMQSDGNLCVYKGTGPADNHGYVWGSQSSWSDPCFTVIQNDGNLCIYRGTDLAGQGGLLWDSGKTG
jgi:hypothetical protein